MVMVGGGYEAAMRPPRNPPLKAHFCMCGPGFETTFLSFFWCTSRAVRLQQDSQWPSGWGIANPTANCARKSQQDSQQLAKCGHTHCGLFRTTGVTSP